MAQRVRWPWRREVGAEELARLELEEGLAQTRLALAQAYAGFNAAADAELVESFVYEIQALQARYSYLLRQRKGFEAPALEGAEVMPALPVG